MLSSKIKKSLSILLFSITILSNLYFYKVPVAYALDGGAGWVYNAMWASKEFGLDTVARFFARRLLKTYLNKIVDQVNKSGRTGRQPSFALNWRNFLTEGQYRGEDVFRAVLSNTELCPYFKNPIRAAFGVTATKPIGQNTRVNNLDPFTRRGKCTLPRGWTIEDYTADFARNGGWEALNRLAEPQNNFYGGFLMSLGELSAQRALDSQADYGEIQAGRGFTGTRAKCQGSGGGGLCLPQSLRPGESGPETKYCTNIRNKLCRTNSDCAVNNSEARCTFLGETLTPGTLLGDSASNYIDQNVSWLITSDELSEVILNMIGSMVDRLTNFRKGTNDDEGTEVDDTTGKKANNAFNRCTRTCSNLSGENYGRCYQDCAVKYGQADLPNNYNVTDPGNQPPDGSCDALAGEDCSGPPIPPPLPPPPTSCLGSQLGSGQTLSSGQCLKSSNSQYILTVDSSGFMLRDTSGYIRWWVAGSFSSAAMQGDGNLVLSGTPPWSTDTECHSGASLTVRDDGSLVILSGSTQVWSSNSGNIVSCQ